MINDLSICKISQVVPTVLGSVTMTVLKLEFSHWWLLLLIDIQALFEAIWGLDRTKPWLDSHELVTCLHFFFFKWVVVILLVLVVIFFDVFLPPSL